jgi:hypothetical protein
MAEHMLKKPQKSIQFACRNLFESSFDLAQHGPPDAKPAP